MSEWKGKKLSLRIFGSSHGPCAGAELDGFPADISVDREKMILFLSRRAPGRGGISTDRQEADTPIILSGMDAQGGTNGQTIRMVMKNENARSGDYDAFKNTPRPGHADYTAWVKYGDSWDGSGGGQFSGRMTAPLCFAGNLCMQYLERQGIQVFAHLISVGHIWERPFDPLLPRQPHFAPGDFPVLDTEQGKKMQEAILACREEGDSLGGKIECAVTGLPVGLGGPLFEGLEGKIAALLFAVPGVKGVEFGEGFRAAAMRGSENNDAYCMDQGCVKTLTNHAGGILGGISDGMPLIFTAAMKPTPSIARAQRTVNLKTGEEESISVGGRHDACIAVRAVPVIEAAAALAICDELLEDQNGK